jgi:hypothetical protein
MDQIWTFNLVYICHTLTGLFAQRITCFPFILYLISCIYDMTPLSADVTKADELRALVDATVDAFGSVDILINNAGKIRYVEQKGNSGILIILFCQ